MRHSYCCVVPSECSVRVGMEDISLLYVGKLGVVIVSLRR